jgi:hypothetical protein
MIHSQSTHVWNKLCKPYAMLRDKETHIVYLSIFFYSNLEMILTVLSSNIQDENAGCF